jgi:hypothetical protein
MNPPYTLRQATDADFLFMRETKFEGMQPYVTAVWGWNQQEQEELFAVGAGLKLVHLAGASLVHTRPLGPPLWLVHVGRAQASGFHITSHP